ncbi:MAG: ATP-binding protein [Chlorobi bacterium]|nr:ATP-binding protein [Chlorobiota bacterium]
MNNKLIIEIHSFSFKKSGIPKDNSGNGGGFVFDCRALPNPGRFDEYRTFTGLDRPVIDFLKNEAAVGSFLENVIKIIDQTVENYLQRGFSHLMVNFGCTGGQHRSVYSAEFTKSHLESTFPVQVILEHDMANFWNR